MTPLSQTALDFCRIPLGNGLETLVDREDYQMLCQWSWHVSKRKNGRMYARRSTEVRRKPTIFYLHRVVTNAPRGTEVDHINGNGLDNRKSNLRVGTKANNMWNLHSPVVGASRFRGVQWHKGGKKWQARIRINGKSIYLGLFDDEEAAAAAYVAAARQLRGELANV